jgi:RecA/RadA recombinase
MSENIRKLLSRNKSKTGIKSKNLLSSGSTILNLMCSGRAGGAYPKGVYIHVPGDSNSGKSWLITTAFAEASINKNFDGYRFITDLPEGPMLMDVVKFFGKRMQDRIEPCRGTKDEPVYSDTVEDFFDWVDAAIESGTPFIGALDSFDAISSVTEEAEIDAGKKARVEGKEQNGTYGTSRAKASSQRFRRIANGLAKTGSILFVISQTRDNIGFGSQLKPKVYAGGNALKFFCKLQLWTSIRESIKRNVKGKDRKLGIVSKVNVTKNHVTGREGDILLPIYWSFGVDDLGSCIDYLIEEKHWTLNKGGVINTGDFLGTGKKDALIAEIQELGKEKELSALVSTVWSDIQDACTIKRKNKYHEAD